MTKQYDVAILGWWHNSNYGSIMTYYALNQAILEQGYSTLLVHEALGYSARHKLSETAPAIGFAKRQGFNYTEQENFTKLGKLNDVASTFVVGSDQLWNPYISRINDDLFLNFTAPEAKRIAYGTSIGNFSLEHFQSDHFGPDFEQVEKQNLERFDWMSMREDDGIAYMAKTFGFDLPQVVDPVFLIDSQKYHELAEQATTTIEGRYMLAFILDPNEEKRRGVEAVADKLGFDRIAVYTDANPNQLKRAKEVFSGERFIFEDEIRSENWLVAYKNAGYVVTDSFHGSCFAFIFQKPFSVFFNKVRGTNRFASLMRLFKLDNSRRIYEENSIEDIKNNPNVSMAIDFTAGNDNLAIETKKSRTWFEKALKATKDKNKILPGATMLANQFSNKDKKFYDYFIDNKFVFYRSNEINKPLFKNFKFLKNGKLDVNSVNNVNWKISNSRLIISNEKFEPTTIFDLKDIINDNNILKGIFIPDGKTVHVLEESDHFNSQTLEEYILVDKDKAIPNNTPARKQIIKNIVKNPKIQNLKMELSKEFSDISLFVGRELKDYTTNKVGGPADILMIPSKISELENIIKYAIEHDIQYTILGNGSNIIVRDGGIRGVTVITTSIKQMKLQGNDFIASSGASLIESSYYLLSKDRKALEWASNIPGTIGGAIYMNAGTNTSDIRTWIKSVKILDESGKIKVLNKHDIEWGKRYSTFHNKKNWIILEATFRTESANTAESVDSMENLVEERARIFPMELPSHGSTFKWWRHPRIIDQAGLTGYRIGGVQISTKQPGFFVNINQATASDYEALINYTVAKVYEFSGFLMEPEVEFIGDRPHQYERYTAEKFGED
ncbi:putative enzyme [Lactococcus piscium]|nr:putative enzyme [Lactococcus piscium]